MKLFGRRFKRGEVLFGEPVDDAAPQEKEEHRGSAGLVPAMDEEPALPVRSREELEQENRALRREISELKSRIAYARSVLLADVDVPESHVVPPVMPEAQVAPAVHAGGAAMGMTGAAPAMGMGMGAAADPAMGAPFASGPMAPAAAGMGAPATPQPQPQPQPADDLRAMLAELKADIASIRREVPQPAMGMAPQPQPADDLRAMLAELKADIASIRREVPQPAMGMAPAQPADDLRAMLAELKADIASIRSEPPVVQRQNDDLREMLSKLKEDIESLKETHRPQPVRSQPVMENGVHRLLAELQQGVAELAGEGEKRVESAKPAREPEPSAHEHAAEEAVRKPLFGGAGEEEPQSDALSSRIESLLAELHNELRQATGGHAHAGGEEKGKALSAERSGSEDDMAQPVEEEPRRQALH